METKEFTKEMRKLILEAIYNSKSGHPGGSLSCTDILAVLYNEEMRRDANDPKNLNRDRFVLSKGHCAPGLYAALAHRGFFPVEDIKTFRKIDSYLEGHPDMKHIPGVDMSSGSLGQGASDADGSSSAQRGMLAAWRELHGISGRDVPAGRMQRIHRRHGDPRGQICGG